jgi:drug/metabolite transporter (DMT)-like permease
MIGAHPTSLAAAGILAALGAAVCRVVILLLTRALLSDADPLRITWYSLLSSTAVFLLAALAAGNWQPPATAAGWLALIVLSAAITAGLLGVFASTVRIGPFRTALFMNLEPPLTAIGSALLLGEVLTPLQMLGGAIMLGALVMFQLRR